MLTDKSEKFYTQYSFDLKEVLVLNYYLWILTHKDLATKHIFIQDFSTEHHFFSFLMTYYKYIFQKYFILLFLQVD